MFKLYFYCLKYIYFESRSFFSSLVNGHGSVSVFVEDNSSYDDEDGHKEPDGDTHDETNIRALVLRGRSRLPSPAS